LSYSRGGGFSEEISSSCTSLLATPFEGMEEREAEVRFSTGIFCCVDLPMLLMMDR
jgi:hypothetical protein